MNTRTIKTLFPFLILLAFLAYNLEADIENSFPNGAMTRNAQNADLPTARTNLDVYSKEESRVYTDTLATAAALAYHPINGSTTMDFLAQGLQVLNEVLIATTTDAGAFKLQVAGNSLLKGLTWITQDDTVGQQLSVRSSSDPTTYINYGLDTTNKRGLIQGVSGASYIPLILNYAGGFVGIATTTPQATLHVVGDALISGLVNGCTTVASTAYVTGYAAKKAGDAAQDFAVKTLTATVDTNDSIETGKTAPQKTPNDFDTMGVSLELSRPDDGTRIHKIYTYNTAGAASNNLGFYSRTDYSFCTNAIEALRLYENGNASFSGDVRATSFTLGGNLKTGSNWISGDGDNEGIYVDGSGNVGVGTNTIKSGFKLQTVGNICNDSSGDTLSGGLYLFEGATEQAEIRITKGGVNKWYIRSQPSSDDLDFYSGALNNEVLRFTGGGETLIATTTDAGNYKLQVNGNAYVNGTIQGAHVASDTTAGISTVVYLATQTMTFKDGLLVSVTNP